MTVADLSVISQTTPVFVCIIAVLFLHEKITCVDTAIITTCFVGVFLVLQPQVFFNFFSHTFGINEGQTSEDKNSYLIASGLMILGSFVNATTTVILKKLASNVNFAVIMFSSGVSTLGYTIHIFRLLFGAKFFHCQPFSLRCFRRAVEY